MSDDDDSISCASHGKATVTYVCGHLAEDPVQRWHGAHPTADNRWPDAWCDRCNETWLRDGEWTDSNSGSLDLKLLCHHCYENAKGDSVGRLRGASLASWEDLLQSCRVELAVKQDALGERFDLWRYARWDWDQDRAEIVFSNEGMGAVVAKIAFVGSLSTRSDTWLWSWANDSLSAAIVGDMAKVRDYGEALNRPHLEVAKWPAEQTDGWGVTAIAAHLLNAEGAYRTPTDNGFIYMLLSDVRRAQ